MDFDLLASVCLARIAGHVLDADGPSRCVHEPETGMGARKRVALRAQAARHVSWSKKMQTWWWAKVDDVHDPAPGDLDKFLDTLSSFFIYSV